ncbi:MAG: isopentenyl-diphosphate Delta-isomerase [bacterium]|nr:isopentenyl-diphosphate Delta-isomerase [bacterium]
MNQLNASNLDLVTLVNDDDEVIGSMDKVEAHRGEGKLHRAISVFLFSSEGKLLLQQRSASKIVGAGQWANTCCGNVWPSESYEECAQRRLEDELGITTAQLTPVTKFQYFAQCNEEFCERELDQVFVGRYDGTVKPNSKEVAETRWLTLDELEKELSLDSGSESRYVPWLKIMFDTGIIQTIKEAYAKSRK